MNGLRSIAALALLAMPGVRIGDDLMAETERGDWDDILFGGPYSNRGGRQRLERRRVP